MGIEARLRGYQNILRASIAGERDRRQARGLGSSSDFGDQLIAVHSWHADIGDHQIEDSDAQKLQRVLCTGGTRGFGLFHFQHHAEGVERIDIVVDQEDAKAAQRSFYRVGRVQEGNVSSLVKGKPDLERRSEPGPGGSGG